MGLDGNMFFIGRNHLNILLHIQDFCSKRKKNIHNSYSQGTSMYYRITHATIQSEMYDQAMATMESIRDSFSEINGLLNSRLIRISETELLGVAAYESKELLEASQTQFDELMSNMAPFLAAPPSVSYGEQVMTFDAE